MNNKSAYVKYYCQRATRERAYSLRLCLRAPLAIGILHVIYHYVSFLLSDTMAQRIYTEVQLLIKSA